MSVPSVNFKMTRTCIKKSFVLLWSLQFLMDQLIFIQIGCIPPNSCTLKVEGVPFEHLLVWHERHVSYSFS